MKKHIKTYELLAWNRSPIPPPHVGIYEVTLMLCNYFPTFNRLGSNYSSEQSRSSSRFSGRSIFSANRAISTLHWRLKEASWHFLSRQSTVETMKASCGAGATPKVTEPEKGQQRYWKPFFFYLSFLVFINAYNATCVIRKETNSYGIISNNTP